MPTAWLKPRKHVSKKGGDKHGRAKKSLWLWMCSTAADLWLRVYPAETKRSRGDCSGQVRKKNPKRNKRITAEHIFLRGKRKEICIFLFPPFLSNCQPRLLHISGHQAEERSNCIMPGRSVPAMPVCRQDTPPADNCSPSRGFCANDIFD